MICAGVDAGSRFLKVVLADAESLDILGRTSAAQGVRHDALASELLDGLLAEGSLGRDDLARTVATGYARHAVSAADATVTEITCHARGVRHVAPEARTVIEIGGQDSKLLRLTPDGLVRDFTMNDRCAAGTGRFLEVVADRLGVTVETLGDLADGSVEPAAISSMCVVFAEAEIIGLLASGAPPEDIVAGVQAAVATRVGAMAAGSVVSPVVLTGGVALISGIDWALARALDCPVTVVPDPQMTGAIGAAILAAKQCTERVT